MRHTLIAALFFAVCTLSAQPVVGTDISPIGCQTVWPNNGSLNTYLDRAQEAGIDTVRSDAMWWGLVEYPNPGEYHFDGSLYPGYSSWDVDNWVTQVTSRGMEPYVILGYANANLYTDPPNDAAARTGYANYCAAAATRYASTVDIWEIWNEPNLSMFWGATPNAADYTALVAAAAPAIRAADSTTIIVGGVTSGIDITYLTTCFDNGLLDDVDVISVHPYRTTAPETVNSEIATLRTLMNGYTNGTNVAIWTGEWGYNTCFSTVDEDGHAKSLLRMMVNNPVAGVELSIWFSMHAFTEVCAPPNAEWGLLDWSLVRRPSWYAMQAINARLPEPVSRIADPYSISYSPNLSNQREEIFERGSTDHRTVAMWLARWPVNSAFTAETTVPTLTVASDFELRAYDGMTGNEIAVDARRNGAQVNLYDLSSGSIAIDMWDYPIFVDVDREVLPAGSNVATGAVAYSADSEFAGQPGNLAYDGIISVASKWTSDGGAPTSWLALDLGQEYWVTGTALRLPSMANEPGVYNAQSVEIQTGPSLAGPWSTAASETNTSQYDRIISVFGAPVAARYVRLLVNDAGTDNYARIPEFEIYSTGATPATLTLLTTE